MKMIVIKKLNKSFGELNVLNNINLEVNQGEVISIIGPSGSGKSTLLRCLIGLEQLDSGSIEIEGVSVKSSKKVYQKMGMVFQGFNLFPHMKILKNVTTAPINVLGISKEEAEERGIILLKKVGLGDKLDYYPSQLSGGQQQRVAIARALIMKPKIMLFDEVTSALDPELVGEVLEVIRDIARETEMSMLLITHEMGFAREIADRIVFLADGNIVEEGPPEKIFENPENERTIRFLRGFYNNNNNKQKKF